MRAITNNLFRIEEFRFEYPNKTSVSVQGRVDINLGETILITGKSGSGKSTFLHTLKGLTPHFIPGRIHGNIEFKGQNLLDLSTVEKSKIALLWQNPEAQFINSTVHKELALPLENLRLNELDIQNRIVDYSKKFHIEHLLNKNAMELSGGEKQKVNLVALLLTDPDVILLDEPTAFLDPESANLLIGVLRDIAAQKTLIIIEHNLHYFKDLITRHFLITEHGELTESKVDTINWSGMRKTSHFNNKIDINPILQIKYYERKSYYTIKDFNLFDGDIVGIIGKNGIGKSTWLKKIAKLDKTATQSIYYKNKDITQIKWQRYFEDVALLLQNSEHHFIYNSVVEELDNETLLTKVGLNTKMAQNPFTLSEGQKRRLAIAIMWNLDRKLYLLDEPTFGQDEDNKTLLSQMIFEMHTIAKTFIIVSHDLPFLYATCNKIFELSENGLTLHDY